MKVSEAPLSGILVIEADVYRDDRGAFVEVLRTRCSERLDRHSPCLPAQKRGARQNAQQAGVGARADPVFFVRVQFFPTPSATCI